MPWAADKISYDGLIVTHCGAAYQALRDTVKEPGQSDDWICIAAAGKGLAVRGTYAPAAIYRAFDVVACNSGSFVALRDGPGPCPGDGWQLLAGPGWKGDKGLAGLAGAPGKDADPLVGWKHGKNLTVVPVFGDGFEGPPLSLRGLLDEYNEVQV